METGVRLGLVEVCNRINGVEWSTENPIWESVIMTGDRIMSGRTAAVFAGRVISYLLGEKLTENEADALRVRYSELTGLPSLPTPLF